MADRTHDAYWLRALGVWRSRLSHSPAWQREGQEAAAVDFLQRFAKEAGAHGWQAAHLFGARGLAWRWGFARTAPPVIRFAHCAMLFPAATVKLGLAAERSGYVRALNGAELTALRGRLESVTPYVAHATY